MLHIYNQHNRHFDWYAASGQSLVAQGNGTVTAADDGSLFHIEGHGTPGNPLMLKNVHADGTLSGNCPVAVFAFANFSATYNDGTQSQGMANLTHNGVDTGGGGT